MSCSDCVREQVGSKVAFFSNARCIGAIRNNLYKQNMRKLKIGKKTKPCDVITKEKIS